ncbi:MAG: hypothetical protein J0L52_09290 [Caulobacterales bacterium]|nr:hypothetical protein [Caulobacterales bacterium]
MRALLIAAVGLSLVTPSLVAAQAVETVRVEQTDILYLVAGDIEEESPFTFNIGYEVAGDTLGAPTVVTWTVKFRDYCRERPTTLQSVVLGPEGQVWRGYRVFVPAGPVHLQYWSSGGNGAERFGGPATPGLLEAMARGGRITLALEDDRGDRLNAVTIETLTPLEREALYQAFRAETQPVRDERSGLVVVEELPPSPPPTPGRCPR